MHQSLVATDKSSLEKNCEQGVSGACALLGRDVAAVKSVSIMQGVTSADQARFVIVLPRQQKLQYVISSREGTVALNPERFTHQSSSAQVDHVEATGLKPGVPYDLIVLGPDGTLWDKRAFRTLDLSRKRARFAVTADMDDQLRTEQTKMWSQLLIQRPDVIFMIGDNVYADRGSDSIPDRLWRRYVETRESLQVFKANPLIPVYAVWDDHDYGSNDGDRTFNYKTESENIFYTFFPQRKPASAFERGPGVASWWKAFGVHFAFLDSRSFRTPNRADLADQTHLGAEQEKWLSDHLQNAGRPVFLISGDQFFGGYQPFESYEGSHPKRFATQLEEWKKIKSPLVFVSGDRHSTEILKVPTDRLGYPTFEITATPIHAPVYPDSFTVNPSPHQFVGAAGKYNYALIEIMHSGHNFLQIDVQAFSMDKEQLFQKTLTVKH